MGFYGLWVRTEVTVPLFRSASSPPLALSARPFVSLAVCPSSHLTSFTHLYIAIYAQVVNPSSLVLALLPFLCLVFIFSLHLTFNTLAAGAVRAACKLPSVPIRRMCTARKQDSEVWRRTNVALIRSVLWTAVHARPGVLQHPIADARNSNRGCRLVHHEPLGSARLLDGPCTY